MKNIKLTIAYDGTHFHGWQFQPGIATIQGAIHDAARKITQEKIVAHGASRTDAGVHALGQVAHFKTRSPLSATEIQRALNALLPPAIRIVAAEEVGHDFHSRWQSQGKTYRYRIYRGKVLPPFEYGRVLHYPWPLDEDAMAAAARQFEGEHDFTSFAASSGSEEDDRDRDMQRVIYSSEIIREHGAATKSPTWSAENRSCATWCAKSWARCSKWAEGGCSSGDIPQVFEARDRSRSGPTVPPEGLYLVALEYPDPADSLASVSSRRSQPSRVERSACDSRPSRQREATNGCLFDVKFEAMALPQQPLPASRSPLRLRSSPSIPLPA